MSDVSNICFVIMGFGRKTDPESGRTLDLDKTYDAIIKPAVERAGFKSIRADEVMHSGLIDSIMYEMLYHADLVIADISTYNANALYELGVRHALRDKFTIIMKESEGRFAFDLSHDAIFQYKHLGEDIGYSEAQRAQKDLSLLISSVVSANRSDSPVYTFLPRLVAPALTKEEVVEIARDIEEKQESISDLISGADLAMSKGDFGVAFKRYMQAHQARPNDIYPLQKAVVARYKSREPSEVTALTDAWALIFGLNPDASNDPETLGIAGSINKKLWVLTGENSYLLRAIEYYKRGFIIRRDYYNGENVSMCFDMAASQEVDEKLRAFYRISAENGRKEVYSILKEIISSQDFSERPDAKWVYASQAHVEYAFGDMGAYQATKEKFIAQGPDDWEVAAFERGIDDLVRYLKD